MSRTKYGHLIPSVDALKCINCSKCVKVCPHLNNSRREYDRRTVFAVVRNDEIKRSLGSSGSIFSALSEVVFSQNGIVFGAAFDERNKLRHIMASNWNQLLPLLKSKYLQSNTEGVYLLVKEHLKQGKKVLFCGTPCQCVALYNFLDFNLRRDLLLVDFICHGVPSQELFDMSICNYQRKHKCTIEKFEFRYKLPTSVHFFKLLCRDKKDSKTREIKGIFSEFPYYYLFKKHLGYRQSCYNCKSLGVDRISDITLADFWNIEKLVSNVDLAEFNKGISQVIINYVQNILKK